MVRRPVQFYPPAKLLTPLPVLTPALVYPQIRFQLCAQGLLYLAKAPDECSSNQRQPTTRSRRRPGVA